jgi:hypothetical protein
MQYFNKEEQNSTDSEASLSFFFQPPFAIHSPSLNNDTCTLPSFGLYEGIQIFCCTDAGLAMPYVGEQKEQALS